LRSRVRSRRRWISSGASHASGSISSPSSITSQRASRRSFFGLAGALQGARLARIGQARLDAARLKLACDRAPARRRLDRDDVEPTVPGFDPRNQRLPRGLEALPQLMGGRFESELGLRVKL